MSPVLLFSVLLFRKSTVQSIFIHIPVHDNTQKQPPVGILLFKLVYFHSTFPCTACHLPAFTEDFETAEHYLSRLEVYIVLAYHPV